MNKHLAITAIYLLSSINCFSAPNWVNAGADALQGDAVTAPYIRSVKSVDTYDADLMQRAKDTITQMTPSIQGARQADFTALKTKMDKLEAAQEFSYEMFAALHIHLSSMVTPAGPRNVDGEGLPKLAATIFSRQTPVHGLMNIAHQSYAETFSDISLTPYVAMVPEDGEIGVKPMLESLLSGKVPYFLVPKSLEEGVHGGLVKTPIDFLMHDLLHGKVIQELFFTNPILSPLREPLLARIQSLSGDSDEQRRQLIQHLFFVHELSADWLLYTGKASFSSPQEYMSNTLAVLQNFAGQTDAEFMESSMLRYLRKVGNQCGIIIDEAEIAKVDASLWIYSSLPEGKKVTFPNGKDAAIGSSTVMITSKENLENPAKFHISTRWYVKDSVGLLAIDSTHKKPKAPTLRRNLQDIGKVLALVHVDVEKEADGTFNTQDIVAKLTDFMADFEIPTVA